MTVVVAVLETTFVEVSVTMLVLVDVSKLAWVAVTVVAGAVWL